MLAFEKLYVRLRLPIWAGAIIIGFLPFSGALAAAYALAGSWGVFVTTQFQPFPVGIFVSSITTIHYVSHVSIP